ncbi:MAG: hypothetical protein JWM95_1356 [Gemmatimonadetes bacterium]|nr:hypothetical protein [Gemmatimonadota bacterium]
MTNRITRALATRSAAFAARVDALAPFVLKAARVLTEARPAFYVKDLTNHPDVIAGARATVLPDARAKDTAGRKLIEQCVVRLLETGAIARLGRRSGYRVVGTERRASRCSMSWKLLGRQRPTLSGWRR